MSIDDDTFYFPVFPDSGRIEYSSLCFAKVAFNPSYASPTKWSNTQTICWQFATNCLTVFDHFEFDILNTACLRLGIHCRKKL